MKLYSGEYSRVDFQEESSLVETVWMPRSMELSKEAIKQELARFLEYIREKSPRSVIADTRYFGFKVDQDLQHWIVLQYMSEIIDTGVSRYAILVTDELYPEVSKNQVNDEGPDDFKVHYFTSHTEAFRWVTSRKN